MKRLFPVFLIAISLLTLSGIGAGASAASLTPAPEGTFTIAVIPDTQRYLGPGSGREEERDTVINPAFESRTAWLAANLEAQRMVFISHMGDIVDKNEPRQWRIARACMDRIHGKIPYGLSVGNHDMEREKGNSRLFQRYFGTERYTGEPWYGGTYAGHPEHAPEVSGNNANSYQVFETGGLSFITVHLECNAPDDVLAWADGVLVPTSPRAGCTGKRSTATAATPPNNYGISRSASTRTSSSCFAVTNPPPSPTTRPARAETAVRSMKSSRITRATPTTQTGCACCAFIPMRVVLKS